MQSPAPSFSSAARGLPVRPPTMSTPRELPSDAPAALRRGGGNASAVGGRGAAGLCCDALRRLDGPDPLTRLGPQAGAQVPT
jgi:hypothetical protein